MNKTIVRWAARGRRIFRSRNPLFDADWYLEHNPDLAIAGYDAYEHWKRHGIAERRDPNAYFRTEWYMRENGDAVASSGGDPLDHYLNRGAAQGLDPSLAFDTDWYAGQHPDVRQSGTNPLLHFLTIGEELGYLPRPNAQVRAPVSPRGGGSKKVGHHSAPVIDPARRTLMLLDRQVPDRDRSAGGLAMWQYAQLLRDQYNVVFVAHNDDLEEPYASDLGALGVTVLTGTRARQWLKADGRSLDYVIAARPDVAYAYEPIVRGKTSARWLYLTLDLHFLREQRRADVGGGSGMPRHVARLREEELELCRAADAVITPSSYEADVLRDLVPGVKAHVVPLLMFESDLLPSVDDDFFKSRDTVLFVGNYEHAPNVDAAIHLVRDLMPLIWQERPSQQVVLAGAQAGQDIEALGGPNVEVTRYLADLAPIYARARLSFAPLRFGAGVKGKILESLAHGVPVVTTSVGAEGIALESGTNALIADGPGDLARAVTTLLDDEALCGRLASAGLDLISEGYSPTAVRDALAEALEGDPTS